MTTYEGRLRRRRACASPSCARGSTTSSPTGCSRARATGWSATASTRRRSPSRGCRAPSSSRWRPSASPASGEFDAVICLGAVIRGDTAALRARGRRVRGGHPASRSSTPACRSSSACSPPRPRAGARARPARRRATRASRRASTAVEMADLLRQLAEGLSDGAPHAACSSCRRARSRRPRSSCSRRPTSRSSRSSDVDYKASIDDPRIDEVRILRPQEIPRYVAEGLFDLGITGRDWIEETAARSCRSASSQYSKASARPVRIVVAVGARLADRAGRGPAAGRAGRPPSTPSSPAGSSRRRASRPTSASPTAPPRPRCPTSSTASSTSPRPAGRCGPPACKIIDTILTSHTELIANPVAYDDPAKRHAMDQLHTLLAGALEARGQGAGEAQRERRGDLDAVIALLPSMKSPTVVEAVRRRRLRGRDRRAEGDDQHAHPGAQGRRRDRHHRAADLQDRPLTDCTDAQRSGRGLRRGQGLWLGRGLFDGHALLLPLHADRRRHPDDPVGADVEFDVGAGRQGRWEAMGLRP